MKDFRNFQNVRVILEDGTIANGDYILEGVTIRCKQGYLNDNVDESGTPQPAIETHDGGHTEHWKNGFLHCEEEPAIIDVYDKYEAWFFEGNEIPPKSSSSIGM